ncbi:MAG TPA: FG-GAP-like repeat-containing protein, partial [Puia sp.]|nr:FG-GAP-like repeat-containing protein [Puia sp.]
LDHAPAHYLKVKFVGTAGNINGLGAMVTIFYDKGRRQVWENAPVRGYLSCVEGNVQFGLGAVTRVDSVVVDWVGGRSQKLVGVGVDRVLTVYEKDAGSMPDRRLPAGPAGVSLFTDITSGVGLHYIDRKPDFIDFNQQKLLLHKFSEYGPALAAGDIDGNGYDDICVGGAAGVPVKFLLQQPGGTFIEKALPPLTGPDVRLPTNMGILLFDADGDGDPDLYLAAGSDEFAADSKNYEDRLFINDGAGNFTYSPNALPVNYTSKSCVKAADMDGDGDLDLFVGGRVVPGQYPRPVSSFIYRNDSKDGVVKFTDVTREVAPQLVDAGLVCDALWTDFDNDGSPDLVLAGEWMAPAFYHNDHGRLVNVTAGTGLGGHVGWWNSLVAGDFDNDGDIDYVMGNMGLNNFYRADAAHPVSIYGGDLAHDGGYIAVTTTYLPDGKGGVAEYPAQSRDDVLEPLPFLKKKFLSYKDFGTATIADLLSPEDLAHAYKRSVTDLNSYYIENLGQGRFALHALPWQAQLAPLYGMKAEDVDGDGNLDLVLAGNDYGAEPSLGHSDAMNGLVMLGDGKGHFMPQTILSGGVYLPGNAKALVKLRRGRDKELIAAAQHGGPLLVFLKNAPGRLLAVRPGDRYAYIFYKNGAKRKEEFYHGDSFLGQSVNFLEYNDKVDHIEITDRQGRTRKL